MFSGAVFTCLRGLGAAGAAWANTPKDLNATTPKRARPPTYPQNKPDPSTKKQVASLKNNKAGPSTKTRSLKQKQGANPQQKTS